MLGKLVILRVLFHFVSGCIPTESPDDRPNIPGVLPGTTPTTTLSTTTTTTPTTTTSTSTTTTTSSTSTTTTTTTTTSTTTTTTTPLYYCPTNWVLFTVPTGETYCYFLSTVVMNHDNSEQDCRNMINEGHLASIHSNEENDFIYNTLILPLNIAPGSDIYTQMTRIGGMSPPCMGWTPLGSGVNPGPFVYEDGTMFTWTKWCPGPAYGGTLYDREPNCYLSNERCVQILSPNWYYYTCDSFWDNIDCARQTKYVCKAPAPSM